MTNYTRAWAGIGAMCCLAFLVGLLVGACL